MALSLKDRETDRLARELRRRGKPGDLAERLRKIGEHCASLPDHDTCSPDEIAGYDETGMWT